MTSTRRPSINLEVITCMAVTLMKQDENTSVAPITGRGMTIKRSLTVGRKAKTTNSTPVASPTTREVTPVATEAPIEPEVVLIAIVPSAPAIIVPNPLAVRPLRIMRMSGRCQRASLIFSTVVKSPMTRSDEAMAAMAKGSAMPAAKTGQPEPGCGKLIRLSAEKRISEVGTMPSAKAAR